MRVQLHCGLCPNPTPIDTTAARAHLAAVDHLLDLHRDALLQDPDGTERSIVVSLPRRSAPLQRAVVAA